MLVKLYLIIKTALIYITAFAGIVSSIEMTFILKKLISGLFMPSNILVILFLISLILLFRNKTKLAKRFFLTTFIWLFIISYPPIVDTLLSKLETNYQTLHNAPKDIKYILVLGGGHREDKNKPITSQIVEASVVRLNEGIRLFNQLKNAKLIVSGYGGVFYKQKSHAKMQQSLAIALGVKKENIILFNTPKDTKEEAIETKKLLNNEKFILVTSAYHMKRAIKWFKIEKTNPIPAPTNHLTKEVRYFDFFSVNTIKNANILTHEILGIIWQEILTINK